MRVFLTLVLLIFTFSIVFLCGYKSIQSVVAVGTMFIVFMVDESADRIIAAIKKSGKRR